MCKVRRLLGLMSFVFVTISSTGAQTDIWDLGVYPSGSYAQLNDINDSSVAVGLGGIGDEGTGDRIRTLVIPVFGARAGQWIALDSLGGEIYNYDDTVGPAISNTGIVVSHSVTAEGLWRAVAWTRQTGFFDLGALADIGRSNYTFSGAYGINKSGTLIVGSSSPADGSGPGLPVAWTSSVIWKQGEWVPNRTIHELDTSGLDLVKFPVVWAWGVNDFGQIIGSALTSDYRNGIGLLWNPLLGGTGWKLIRLPKSLKYPFAWPTNINNKGEISGLIFPADNSKNVPAYWKPLTDSRNVYSRPVALPLPEGFSDGCWIGGLNEPGDISGQCWGTSGSSGVHWTIKHSSFSEIVVLPGDWSSLRGVNNKGIAVGTYGGGTCAGWSCGVAVRFK